MDEAVVAVELEHAFGENPAASDGETCLASLDAEDTLSEGGSNNENLRTYYFGQSTITISKIKEMVEKGYFRAELVNQGPKLCRSWTTMKPWYTKTFLSLACACLLIRS
jgi:hypothetical protein